MLRSPVSAADDTYPHSVPRSEVYDAARKPRFRPCKLSSSVMGVSGVSDTLTPCAAFVGVALEAPLTTPYRITGSHHPHQLLHGRRRAHRRSGEGWFAAMDRFAPPCNRYHRLVWSVRLSGL